MNYSASELRNIRNQYWNKDADKLIDIRLKCLEEASKGKYFLAYYWPEVVENKLYSKLTQRQISILYTLETQGYTLEFEGEYLKVLWG